MGKFEKIDSASPLLADPPHNNSTNRQNPFIYDHSLYIVVAFEPIMRIKNVRKCMLLLLPWTSKIKSISEFRDSADYITTCSCNSYLVIVKFVFCFLITNRKYLPLRRPFSSSWGGLQSLAKVFFALQCNVQYF